MKTDMKRLVYILSCILTVLSCSGKVDPEGDNLTLTLKTDTDEIIADGKSEVNFTVLNGPEDVTAGAVISCTSGNASFSGSSFSTSNEGTYRFSATYQGKKSEEVTVTAVAPAVSRFQRHVCVMEFTGTWCAMCPDGAQKLDHLVNRTYKDKAFAMAFHNEDIYSIPQEGDLKKIFKWETYPAYVTDMRDCGQLNEGTCGATIEKSLYDVPTHCGVSLESKYDATSSSATVKVKLMSEKKSSYRLAVYIVEDKIVGDQVTGTELRKDYTHRHVVRKMLSANVRGDELGIIGKDEESEKGYQFAVDTGKWNITNLYVYALAINEDGQVNNMALCAVDGGRMDYVYLK